MGLEYPLRFNDKGMHHTPVENLGGMPTLDSDRITHSSQFRRSDAFHPIGYFAGVHNDFLQKLTATANKNIVLGDDIDLKKSVGRRRILD